jgi:putative DNA primase/helicase
MTAYTKPYLDLDPEAERPPEFTDEALALEFARTHSENLRYVAEWGKWLLWTGDHWRFDDSLQVFNLSRHICRKASAKALSDLLPRLARRVACALASAKTVSAVERLARSDRRLAATVDQWDRDPALLNTPDGVVDLRTGVLRPHERTDHCTKITAVGPAAPGTPCPMWMHFHQRVTNGDQDLIAFLRRMAGYALTGFTKEHALFFAYGTGRNGKGVFTNTLTGIMGTYAAVASMETFTASKTPQHPTDLAMLRGARLVTAQETEEGRQWAESKIKTLTGGDPVTARFMKKDFFTYQPQFKLLIAGNHKPGIRGVDEAIKARLNLIHFKVTIPPEERDRDLPDKLKTEWAAILRWAIDGCLEWQQLGLDQPVSVRDATEEYLSQEDSIAIWLDECCVQQERARENTAELYASWKVWAERTGEQPGTSKRLSQAMQARGFTPKREPGTGKRGFDGIRLKRHEYSDDPRCGS